MKALILTGGRGKRLRPFSWFVAKPMTRIKGKPVLEYIVDYFNHYGIKEIIINLHYKPTQFLKHFGNRLTYVYEPELLGEEGTIESVKKWVKNDYLIVQNGDTLTNLNLPKMFKYSKGRSIKFMDKGVYAGTRIIEPGHVLGDKQYEYEDPSASWIDMGTFEGLKKARKDIDKYIVKTELN